MSKYIGLPYCESDQSGYSCWGLVRLVLNEKCGIDVPTYGDTDAKILIAVSRRMLQEAEAEIWQNVEPDDLSQYDVVLMRGQPNRSSPSVRTTPVHAGIMMTQVQLLHTTKETNSVQVPMTHWSIRSRIISFYRHKDLKN